MKRAKMKDGIKVEESKIIEGITAVHGKTVTIRRKASTEGNLFASLHTDAITAAVYDQLGACLPEELFHIDYIKALGIYDIDLAWKEKKGKLTLLVERES